MSSNGGRIKMNQDKVDKYLNKKSTYKRVDTVDNLYQKSLDQADKDQKKFKKKMDKMLIRDQDGNVIFEGEVVRESEDGVMAYTTAHPHGGRGRKGYNKGITCPHCGKTIDLRR
jgi:hypothetical protein